VPFHPQEPISKCALLPFSFALLGSAALHPQLGHVGRLVIPCLLFLSCSFHSAQR